VTASEPTRLFRPDLAVLAPAAWRARASIELVEPNLRAHVVMTLDDLGEDDSLDSYSGAYGTVLAERAPHYEELRREMVALSDGRPVVVRRFRWRAEGAEPVEQVQVYVVQGGRGLAATLSSPRPLDELEPRVLELVEGARLEGRSGGMLARVADDPRSRTYAAFERGELATTLRRALGNGHTQSTGRDEWTPVREAWERAARP
jgi:hypothetical protein